MLDHGLRVDKTDSGVQMPTRSCWLWFVVVCGIISLMGVPLGTIKGVHPGDVYPLDHCFSISTCSRAAKVWADKVSILW